MTSMEADPCLDEDADLLQDLSIGFVPRSQPAAHAAGSPRRSAAIQPAAASPAPSVVDLLSDSDMAPSPSARDAATRSQSPTHPPAKQVAARMPRDGAADDTAVRSPSVDRLLADMVDLLSGSDDDPDAALAAALAAEGDCGAETAAGSPAASPPRRKSSSRRVRKPARFKDADAGLVSPPAAQSAQRSGGGADRGPTVWPSPPEDSFITNDERANSVAADVDDAPDPSPQPKRCGPRRSQDWSLGDNLELIWVADNVIGAQVVPLKVQCSPNVVPVSAGGKRTRSRLTGRRKNCSAR